MSERIEALECDFETQRDALGAEADAAMERCYALEHARDSALAAVDELQADAAHQVRCQVSSSSWVDQADWYIITSHP